MASTGEKWSFDLRVLPGSPAIDHLVPIFERLFGAAGLIEPRKLDRNKITASDPVTHLADLYSVAQSRTKKGHNMFVDGQGASYISVSFSLRRDAGGTIGGMIPGVDPNELVESVSELMELTEGLFGSVFLRELDGGDGILSRGNIHLKAAREARGRDAFPFWVRWGLPGLAWRSMLGRPFVELVGKDRLRAVGPDLAWPVGEHWVVAGCDDPAEWTVDPMCSQERSLIDQLGPEHFFDVETGRRPTVLPKLPPHPSFPVTFKDAEPTPTPEPADPDPLDQLRAKAAWVVQRMTEMIPDFEDDAQLYWVEEFLRDSAADDHDYLVDLYGAWLGEHLRKAIDGTWVETADGWMVRGPNGAIHDPHGRMRAYLEDNTAELDPWIRSITDPG